MPQHKISMPAEEWKLIHDYYETNKEELKLEGIRSPTMLLRRWALEKYKEKTTKNKPT
ncbi:MAG: hypothetical protein ACFCUE_13995 [Candidatus Bathyarchaeia archaeon]